MNAFELPEVKAVVQQLVRDDEPYSWDTEGRYMPSAARPRTCQFGIRYDLCSPAYLCGGCVDRLIADVTTKGGADV